MEGLSRRRGPGLYEIKNSYDPDILQRQATHPGWARELEMKKLAAMPHLLNKDQWEERKMLTRRLGPGKYDIKDFVDVGKEKPVSSIGICGYMGKRMRPAFSEKTPGPGTYGEGGIPHSAIEQKAQLSTSTVGMLDQATSGKRDLPTVGCDLGPGNYNFKSSVTKLLETQTGNRGPYDVFSLDRNKPIKTGHYAKFGASTLGPGQYSHSSFTDDLDAYNNKYKGKVGKANMQHPEKAERIFYSTLSQVPKPDAADRPGPTSYDPKIAYPKPENKGDAGFLSNSVRTDKRAMRFFTGNYNSVGAGRYNVHKFHESRSVNGHESVFKSKTGRLEHTKEPAFRERLREKDVKKEDRIFLVEIDRSRTVM